MRKTVTAAAMAASLTIGGAAGAALFVPDLVAAQEDGITDESTTDEGTTERHRKGAWVLEALAGLVEDGTLTQEQAEAVVGALQEARPDRPGHHRPGKHLGEALTEVLGMTGPEIRAAVEGGQTIAEIAEAQGVSVDDVIAALVAEVDEKLDTAVENGRITDEEAAEKLEDATERITDFVNGEHDGDFGDRDRGGPRGGFGGPGDDTTDS